jgi:mono/diheme cytochrome c family protein
MWPAIALLAALACGESNAQKGPGASRGELLYTTHCIACHTSQMHWRDQRQAADWAGLLVHVRRWQNTAGLQWGDQDIGEVARFLNATIYHYPMPDERAGAQPSPSRFARD